MQTYHFDDRNVAWQTVEFIGAQIYEPHSEGTGDQMAIVLFSFRGSTGP
jgi:hypothetical protein